MREKRRRSRVLPEIVEDLGLETLREIYLPHLCRYLKIAQDYMAVFINVYLRAILLSGNKATAMNVTAVRTPFPENVDICAAFNSRF